MQAVYDHPVSVAQSDIDFLGHVNNLNYLAWFIDAGVAHSSANGWPTRRYVELGSGWVVRSHFIEYSAPAFANDELIVSTWIARFSKVRCLRKYRITRTQDERIVAQGETVWSFVSFEKQAPVRIPEEVASCFIVHDEAS